MRYADDFLLSAGSKADARRALDVARTELARPDLALHPDKTRIIQARPGVGFLGQPLPAYKPDHPKHNAPDGDAARSRRRPSRGRPRPAASPRHDLSENSTKLVGICPEPTLQGCKLTSGCNTCVRSGVAVIRGRSKSIAANRRVMPQPVPQAAALPLNLLPASTAFPPLSRLRFRFQAQAPLQLPAYTGSAWHGLLGHALRRGVCVTGQRTCGGCLLTGSCAYAVLFESPPADPQLAKRYQALPHPYVLEPDPPAAPQLLPAGGTFGLGLTLIGAATAFVPHLVHALRGAGALGFGAARTGFSLIEVTQEQTLGSADWAPIYTGAALSPITTHTPAPPRSPVQAHLHLQTPLRLKASGRLLSADAVTGADLLRALGQRAELLQRVYAPTEDPAQARWTDARQAVHGVEIVHRDLHWHDWARFSNRQATHMQLGGLLGQLTLGGPALAAVWPLLWFGQWLHAGKNTAFGLGRYRVTDTGRDSAQPIAGTATGRRQPQQDGAAAVHAGAAGPLRPAPA